MKKFILLIISILFLTTSFSQVNSFVKVYYDSTNADMTPKTLIEAIDGGYIIVGTRNQWPYEGFVLKVDSTGDHEWNKIFKLPGSNSTVEFNNIISTMDSSYVIVGRMYDASINSDAALVMKINLLGDTLWTQAVIHGTASPRNLFGIIQAPDSSIIVTGYVSNKLLVLKIDNNGNLIWSKSYQGANSENTGYFIKKYDNNKYVISISLLDYPPYTPSAGFLMIDDAGNNIWSKKIKFDLEYINPGGNEFVIKNNRIISGFNGNSVAEMDTSGNVYWMSKFYLSGPPDCINCKGNRLQPTLDGGYIITTHIMWYASYATKIDSAGNIVWHKQITNRILDVISLPDSTYIFHGGGPLYLFKTSGPYTEHIGLVKTDQSGNSFCSVDYNHGNVQDSLIVSNITFTQQSGGTTTSFNPLIFSIPIISYPQCVDFTDNVEEINNNNYIIHFPNPAIDHIVFKTNNLKDANIKLFDVTGKIIFEQNIIDNNELKIDLKKITPGIYFYQVLQNEIIINGKFIKQ